MTSGTSDSAPVSSVTRGLSLLASAIAGRRLAVVAGDTGVTYTDGQQIYVNHDAVYLDLRDSVVMQAAFLAGGTFQRSIVRQLAVRRAPVGSRYLILEAARLAHQFGDFLPQATVARVQSLSAAATSGSPQESLRRALGGETIACPPEWIGAVKTRRLLRAADSDLGGAPTDNDVAGLTQIDDQPELTEDEAENSEESRIMKLLSAPGVSNPLARAIQRLLGMGRTESTTQAGGAELSAAGQRATPVGRHAKKTLLNRAVAAVFEPTPEGGRRYPEWNVRKGAYRPDWCLVVHYDPTERDGRSPGGSSTVRTLRRPIARVGLEHRQHLRQSDGDSLDLSALVDYQIDRHLGEVGEPRIYARSLYTKRDLSVLVLLDSSGSTAEGSEGRTVFEGERQLAEDLTDSLENLGDHVATYGFYSQGKDSVRFLRVKEFGDRFDATARRRLTSIEPTGFTRFGAAIRHGGHLLESHALSRNMILVYIGDGLPYDEGYEDSYARADSCRAIRETIHRGVGVVGLAIRSSTEPPVVEEIWADAPFRVVGSTEDARRHLRPMLLDAIRMTRTNGRRRELVTGEHHQQMQTLLAAKRSTPNSYV